jgi:hypothetical protein
MNSEHTPSARAIEFRRALVATANLGPYVRRRPPLKLVVGLLAAFVLAGALTGGAVATASTVDPEVTAAEAGAAEAAHALIGQVDGVPIGEPFIRTASGTQEINIGVRPRGATNLVEGFECIDPGDFVGLLDSTRYEESPDCEPASEYGGIDSVTGSGGHILTIQARGSARFSIWLSWVKIPTFKKSAAQRQELADGVITRDEDVAAFSRYEGCMAALGHPVDNTPTSIVPAYYVADAAVEDGSDNRCYETEYKDVDMKWQMQLEQTDIGDKSIDACLSRFGVKPAVTPEARMTQLQALIGAATGCPWIG